MQRTPISAFAVLSGFLFRSSLALAGEPSTDAPTAAELFVQGRAAMAANRYEEACPKFSESFRLDPHVGSLISLAECEGSAGHLALARTHWQEAIDFAHRVGDSRETAAAERFAAIDLRVPRLTLRWGAAPPPDATVTKDGVVISALSFATPLPVEVGEHLVSVSAPGYALRAVTTTLTEGESKDLVLELGLLLPPSGSERPAVAPRRSPMKTAALITGGVGAAAIVAGAGFGIATLVQSKQPNGDCPQGGTCNSQGAARNAAFAWGDVSTGLFIGGGGLVSAAAVMWLVPTRARPASTGWNVMPAIGPGSGELRVVGGF